MTKRRACKRQPQWMKPSILLPIIGGLGIAIVLVAALLLQSDEATEDDVITEASVTHLINADDYQTRFIENEAGHLLLDVRTPEEFADGHIVDAANIAVETLASRLDEVPDDQPIVVYCRSGNRSAQAARILQQAGYTNIYDLGGIINWQARGYALVQ